MVVTGRTNGATDDDFRPGPSGGRGERRGREKAREGSILLFSFTFPSLMFVFSYRHFTVKCQSVWLFVCKAKRRCCGQLTGREDRPC